LRIEGGAGVQVVGVRPAGEGRALLVRVLNASDQRQEARVGGGKRAWLEPWELTTLRVE
jgi:hypothetical protein